MSASRVLALATLFLATTFARAEWKEFRFPDGNFRVVFPESPQPQQNEATTESLSFASTRTTIKISG